MSVLTLQPCPTDCTGSNPDVSFSECAGEFHYGEISKLYVAGSTAAAFTNVDLLAEWTTRLSDTDDGVDSIRTLVGIGELPEPEQTETAVSGGRTIYSPKTFNLAFEVDETNDTNYNYMLSTYCNSTKKVWIEMSDGMLYGGNEGIELILRGSQPLLKGRKDILKMLFKGKWESASDPLRCISPMF
jgi:hypothetical protein